MPSSVRPPTRPHWRPSTTPRSVACGRARRRTRVASGLRQQTDDALRRMGRVERGIPQRGRWALSMVTGRPRRDTWIVSMSSASLHSRRTHRRSGVRAFARSPAFRCSSAGSCSGSSQAYFTPPRMRSRKQRSRRRSRWRITLRLRSNIIGSPRPSMCVCSRNRTPKAAETEQRGGSRAKTAFIWRWRQAVWAPGNGTSQLAA